MNNRSSSERVYSPPPQLTPFTIRSAWCAVQCINLAKSFPNNFPPVLRNSTTTSLFFLARDPRRRPPPTKLNKIILQFIPNGWTRQAYLQGWDFERKIYKATCDMLKWMKITEKSMKGEKLLKHQLGQMPTVPVMTGIEREDNPPRLPTPTRAALASARKKTRPSKQS